MTLLLSALVSGCATTESGTKAHTPSPSSERTYSGFLGDYPEFEPALYGGDALVYVAPDADLKRYQQLIIDPVTIWLESERPDKGIDPEQLQAVADAVRQSFVEKLNGAYPVVSEPGEGVLWLRFAITNVVVTPKSASVFARQSDMNADPIQLAAGEQISLQKATAEAELVDSVTGDRLAAAIQTTGPQSGDERPESGSWQTLQDIVDSWTEGILRRWDFARGVFRAYY